MSTSRVYLVRHGQSVANVTKQFSCRVFDPPLTELGVLQAQITAAHIRNVAIDALYTSPLVRAVQTADLLAEALGIGYEVVEEFREVNVGELEHHPPTPEAWAIHDGIMADWAAGRKDAVFPGGEDYHGLTGRATRALTRILGERPGQTVAIVAHGGIVTALVDAICADVSMAELVRLANANCSITSVDARLDGARLVGTLDGWASCTHLNDPRLPGPG